MYAASMRAQPKPHTRNFPGQIRGRGNRQHSSSNAGNSNRPMLHGTNSGLGRPGKYGPAPPPQSTGGGSARISGGSVPHHEGSPSDGGFPPLKGTGRGRRPSRGRGVIVPPTTTGRYISPSHSNNVMRPPLTANPPLRHPIPPPPSEPAPANQPTIGAVHAVHRNNSSHSVASRAPVIKPNIAKQKPRLHQVKAVYR